MPRIDSWEWLDKEAVRAIGRLEDPEGGALLGRWSRFGKEEMRKIAPPETTPGKKWEDFRNLVDGGG